MLQFTRDKKEIFVFIYALFSAGILCQRPIAASQTAGGRGVWVGGLDRVVQRKDKLTRYL